MQSSVPDAKPLSGVRWTICALIFFATTVNYLDRQLFSNLVPFFEDSLKLGPTDLALINVSFILPYGLSMLFVGRFIDKVGIRFGLGTTFTIWTLASIGHAFVRSLAGFCGIRFILGVGESGMYPGAVKTMADWFPAKERALANGIFNAGANLGAILAPFLGVKIAQAYGWQAAFEVLGAVGMVWLVFWLVLYRSPKDHLRLTKSEYEHIHQDDPEPTEQISYSQLFGMRPVYGLAIAKALTDGPSWFIMLWLPKILIDQFHVSLEFMALAIPVVYIIGDIGSVGGGWLSSRFLKQGWSVDRSRKTVMLGAAACVLPVSAIGFLVDKPAIAGISCVYWAIAILAIAAAAHQAWSSNLFTVISDTVPKNSMAMAVGAINGFAMFGVSAMQFFVGRMVQLTSSYTIPFMVAGTLYLVGFVFLQIFIPKVGPYPTHRRAKIPFVFAGVAVILAGLGYMLFVMNKPPYISVADYVALRQTELHAIAPPIEGPAARVRWMESHWYTWTLPGGKTKSELIKLDTHGHPFIEEKGAKANKYVGPNQP